MAVLELSGGELIERLSIPLAAEDLADATGGAVVVDLDSAPVAEPPVLAGQRLSLVPAVIVGTTRSPSGRQSPLAALCDVVLPAADSSLAAVLATVEACPRAATALVLLLRGAEERSVGQGLLAESAVYSTLQGGPEFARWRASASIRPRPPQPGPAVRVERHGEHLELVLNRPQVRNAFNTAMRDELWAALAVAAADPSVREVHLRGEGRSFCSGGDLDEFGSFPDPATAHLVRVARSVGSAIAAVAERVVVHLHGAAVGSGIELPAFAGRVLARRDTRIALPEIALGLVPGAGGTVSLPRRIGRQRTAELALSATPIDAATALGWGLVDAIEE